MGTADGQSLFSFCWGWGKGEKVEERTRKRDVGGLAAVVLAAVFLNSLGRVSAAVGSSYSAVHGAIGLKLPSVAIFPWVHGRLLRKNAAKINAANPPTSLFRCFVSGCTL